MDVYYILHAQRNQQLLWFQGLVRPWGSVTYLQFMCVCMCVYVCSSAIRFKDGGSDLHVSTFHTCTA